MIYRSYKRKIWWVLNLANQSSEHVLAILATVEVTVKNFYMNVAKSSAAIEGNINV